MSSSKKDAHHGKIARNLLLLVLVLVTLLIIFVLSFPPPGNNMKIIEPSTLLNYIRLYQPSIALHDNNIYFVWSKSGVNNTDIFLEITANNGVNIDGPENISDNLGNSTDPRIAVYGNATYVVWKDDSSGNDEIYLKVSEAGKSVFGRIFNLSRNNGSSTDPQIAVYGNATYVVWKDNSTGNDEIYLKVSEAGKSKFGRLFNLSRNNGSSTDPQIAVYGNATFVVWKDNSSGNDKIYLKVSEAGKSKFGKTIQ